MTEQERIEAGLSPELLEIARQMTDGKVSARRHAASRARVFDRCASVPRRSSGKIALLVVATSLMTGSGAVAVTIATHRPSSAAPSPAEAYAAAYASAAAAAAAAADAGAADNDSSDESDEEVNVIGTPGAADATVKIHVSPQTARVFWDSTALDGSPPVVKTAPDDKPHRVRAEAPGYASKTQMLVFDRAGAEIWIELTEYPVEFGPIQTSRPIPDADAVLEDARTSLRACFNADITASPALAGSATIALAISAKGPVTEAKAREVHGLPPRVTSCFEYVLQDLKFAPSGGPSTLRVPITYRGK